MKKVYVAPVMECEEFVTNEYVAACIQVTCKGGSYWGDFNHKAHGSFTYQGEEPIFDNWDKNGDGFVNYEIPNYGDAYSGTIGNVNGPHPVTWKDITSAEHPNASV